MGPNKTREGEGSGGVTVVDASGLQFSSMADVSQSQAVCLLGLRVHLLVAGATYNLHTRIASPGSLVTEKT